MSHHESIREEYETVIRRRDEHQELSHRAFRDNNYEEAFRHRREVLKEDKRLSDLIGESSDRRNSERNQRSLSVIQGDHPPHLLLMEYPDEWDD